MTRLIIHVEGQTEESFVNELLAPHLYTCGFTVVGARLLGSARQRDRRGGIRSWQSVRGEIANHLKQDPGCYATTMVDFYALPSAGARAWPGRAKAAELPFAQKAVHLEQALCEDLQFEEGTVFDPARFIPFVTMHEFEALLFSDCAAFGRGIGRPDLEPLLQQIRDQFSTPEEINDSPLTAPSKRVADLLPGYEKPLLGALAALEIGLVSIRAQCPHFSGWLDRLEAIPAHTSMQ